MCQENRKLEQFGVGRTCVVLSHPLLASNSWITSYEISPILTNYIYVWICMCKRMYSLRQTPDMKNPFKFGGGLSNKRQSLIMENRVLPAWLTESRELRKVPLEPCCLDRVLKRSLSHWAVPNGSLRTWVPGDEHYQLVLSERLSRGMCNCVDRYVSAHGWILPGVNQLSSGGFRVALVITLA